MARAKWKFLFYSRDVFLKSIILNVKRNLIGKNKIVFTKSSSIPYFFLNRKVNIYKGFFFRKLLVNKFICGYKFGEFSFTRKPFKFLAKVNVKKEGSRR